ncbi:MAG: sulfotransferase domain-containing protein [Cyclobacteriaceae bacterium]
MIKNKIKRYIKSLMRLYQQVKAESTPIQVANNQGENLIFATGFDKSGTTWLMDILNLHPDITCRGSGQIFNFYKDIHFLAERGGYGIFVKNPVEARWFSMGGKVWFDEKVVTANFRNFVAASFERYNIKKSRYVGDKSTVQDVSLIRKIYPKAKIICMVRDVRDVAVSFAYHFKRGDSNKFNDDGTFQETYLRQVMEAWCAYSAHIRSNLSDSDLMIIKYEDMLSNTSAVISEIYQFMNVNTDDNLLKKVVEETSFENMSGGRKAGVEDQTSYFRKGIVGDWLNHFGEKEKGIIRQIGGEELIHWNYTKDLNW